MFARKEPKPDPDPLPPPIEPTIQGGEEPELTPNEGQDQRVQDTEFLHSFIAGGEDMDDPTIIERLTGLFETYAEDSEMMLLLNDAANAYQANALTQAGAATGQKFDSVQWDSTLDSATGNDMHWITVNGAHLLVQGNDRKGYTVRGGGGGKFNGQKWRPKAMSQPVTKEHHAMTRQEFHDAHKDLKVSRVGNLNRKKSLDAHYEAAIRKAVSEGKAVPAHAKAEIA